MRGVSPAKVGDQEPCGDLVDTRKGDNGGQDGTPHEHYLHQGWKLRKGQRRGGKERNQEPSA